MIEAVQAAATRPAMFKGYAYGLAKWHFTCRSTSIKGEE